jgi:hypothetical protein
MCCKTFRNIAAKFSFLTGKIGARLAIEVFEIYQEFWSSVKRE